MNKHLIASSILFLILLTYSCQNRKITPAVQPKEPAQQQTAQHTETKSIPFTPPADSQITLPQMKAWLLSNTYLDSLTFRYADSFKTSDPSLRLRYQEDFISAQNKICVRAGLPGGYEEYTWIMKTSGNPKNKAVLDSAHAEVH